MPLYSSLFIPVIRSVKKQALLGKPGTQTESPVHSSRKKQRVPSFRKKGKVEPKKLENKITMKKTDEVQMQKIWVCH